MNAADSMLPSVTNQIVSRCSRRDNLSQPNSQPEERGFQEERAQPLHCQRRAEDVADQPRVRPPVHPELKLLHDSGHHTDRDVNNQQRAEESSQSQIIVPLGPVPGRLKQRGQKSQPNRHRDKKEMVDRCKSELPPRKIQRHPYLPGNQSFEAVGRE